MPDQDAAEDRALAAANAISDQVGQLWMNANADGIRTGMDMAAEICSQSADNIAEMLDVDSAVRDAMALCARELRDQIRLCALQIPNPEVPDRG